MSKLKLGMTTLGILVAFVIFVLPKIFDGNKAVEFYARIVDQNGVPVDGIKLRLEISRWDGSFNNLLPYYGRNSSSKEIELRSDENGIVEVAGESGFSLRFMNFIDSDCRLPIRRNEWSCDFEEHKADKENPIQLKVWRGEINPNAKKFRNRKTIRFNSDSGFQEKYLQLREDGVASLKGADGANFSVHLQEKEGQGWVVKLVALIDGGLVLAKDNFGYQAPIGGYSKVVSVNVGEEVARDADKHKSVIYLKWEGGYASLLMKVTAAKHRGIMSGYVSISELSISQGVSRNLLGKE